MATLIEKNTKKLIEQKLDALFAKQQQLNGNKGGSDSGLPKAEDGWGEEWKWKGNIPNVPRLAATIPNKSQINPISGLGLGYTPPKIDTSKLAPMPNYERTKGLSYPKSSNPWGEVGKVGSFLAGISPIVYNLAKGLGKPEKVLPKYNPYEAQALNLMRNRRMNVNPMLEQNMVAQAVANRNLRQVGFTGGRLAGNLAANQNMRMRGDANTWATKQNADLGYMGQEAEFMYNAGRDRSMMDWTVQEAQAQNLAARNRFLGQGFADASEFAQINKQMSNQKYRDSQLAGLYPDMYSQIYQFQPFMQEIVNAAKAGR